MSKSGFLFQLNSQWVYLKIPPKNVHLFYCGVWLVEIKLNCNSYFFAFSLRLLIRLNINCWFEYKKGYLSFALKGLSCGFSTTYFDKINGETFCEKIKLYRQIVHKYSPSSPNCYKLSSSFIIMHLFLTSSCHHIAWTLN
jgi:hypothetical protein